MQGLLSRLFHLAKSERRWAVEDFTTEYLAAAIRHDPKPLIEPLREAGIDIGIGHPDLEVLTQLHVQGAGRIDLVIRPLVPERARDIWIEVKVDAGESGDQLQNYLAYASTIPDGRRPVVATLSNRPLRPDVPALTWQALWDSANSSSSPYWKDLRIWMEERGMADGFNRPITSADLAGWAPAYSLLRKAGHVLETVADHVRAVWPESRMPNGTDKTRLMAAAQFYHNRFAIHSRVDLPAYLMAGFRNAHSTIRRSVWIETRPRDRYAKRALLERATAGGLPPSWVKDDRVGERITILAEDELLPDTELSEHTGWFIARIDELASAGLLDLIPRLGQAAPNEAVERGA